MTKFQEGETPRKTVAPAKSGRIVDTRRTAVEKVMTAAGLAGLRGKKTQRISGRVSPELVRKAKKHTGLQSDTDLVEFALANLALDDNFARTFRKVGSTVDPDLDLGF